MVQNEEVYGVMTCFKNSASLCLTVPVGACRTHKIRPGDKFLCRVDADSILKFEKVGQQGKHHHTPPADNTATQNQMNDGGITGE
ncbi:hypothetical protein [Methanogenium cariaci]|jgi:hypothetical protein